MIDHHHPAESILNRAEVQNMKNDMSSLKANGSELVRGIAHEGNEIMREEIGRIKQSGREKILKAENHIKNRPGQSIAFGVAAGLLLSYVLARRR